MAEYLKYLRQLLALSGESFEEELWRLVSVICYRKPIIMCVNHSKFSKSIFTMSLIFQGFSTSHLGPMEVLSAIYKAQEHLNHEFTHEEFTSGTIGQLMEPSDFTPEPLVSF